MHLKAQVSYSIQNTFDQDAFLSQSGQLYLEAAAMAHRNVFHLVQRSVLKSLKHVVI